MPLDTLNRTVMYSDNVRTAGNRLVVANQNFNISSFGDDSKHLNFWPEFVVALLGLYCIMDPRKLEIDFGASCVPYSLTSHARHPLSLDLL